MSDLIFEFKKNGKPCGFLSCDEKDFIFKTDKGNAVMIPLEKLKNTLRVMVKNKAARIIKAGTTEAVVVPGSQFYNLFI